MANQQPSALSLFPARVIVGYLGNDQKQPIYMSAEFYRALNKLFVGYSGIAGDGGMDVFAQSGEDSSDASVALEAAQAPSPDFLAEMVLQPVMQEAWPIGSVFTAVVDTDPAILLGYGVWTEIGAGRVLVGLDSGDPDFDTLEETGGAKTKAISAHVGTAVATHPDHTHQVTSNVTGTTDDFTATGSPAIISLTNNTVTSGGASITLDHSVTQPNNHTDLNVVQPYFVVKFWKRTA